MQCRSEIADHGSTTSKPFMAVTLEEKAHIPQEYFLIAMSGRQYFPISVGAQLSNFEAMAELYSV